MKNTIVIVIVCFIGCNVFSQNIDTTKLSKKVNDIFESYAHYNRFVGNVLISKNDRIIYKKSFGLADPETLKKHTENTIFNIASVTKPLTAVAIMQLVEQGKLDLETPISTFFSNFIPEYSNKITIRHLLNHSSGMQANIGRIDNQGNGLMPGENKISLNELLEKFKNSKLKHLPGKGYEYNNFGYTLLAYIIEKVTKQSYANYMQQAIFTPANMKNTMANNYKLNGEKAYPQTGLGLQSFKKLHNKIHTSWLKGAGNVTSTTVDLYQFLNALENGTLLKPATVEKLYTYTQARGVNDSKYGLGWRIQFKNGKKWINHTGLLPGVTAIIGTLPAENIKIIMLTNATTTDLITESNFQGKNQFVDNEIINNLIDVLNGNKVQVLPKPVLKELHKTANYSRTYQLDKKHTFLLKNQENVYTIESLGKEPWSVFTYQFSRNLKKQNSTSNTAIFFAKAMSTQNFIGLDKYANDQMKGFLGSEKGINQLKGMWSNFLKNAGSFKSYNIYKTAGETGSKTVHIRFHFEKEDVGFVLGINKKNQIQGMFMDDAIRTSSIKKVNLIQLNTNEFFINGHLHNGMQDLRIKMHNNELIIIDDNLQFKAKLIDNKL